MLDKIELLKGEMRAFQGKTRDDLEAFRLKYVSRKGALTELFEDLKKAPAEERKTLGKSLNDLKQAAETKFKELSEALEISSTTSTVEIDLTLPPVPDKIGNRHPLHLTRDRIIQIFERLGFSVADGPEIEDDRHNFSALNFAEISPK